MRPRLLRGCRGDLGLQGRKLGALLVIAMLAAIYSLWTLYGAGAEAFWWSMALFAVGLPVYAWSHRKAAREAPAAAATLP